MKSRMILAAVVVAALAAGWGTAGAVPNLLQYQGRLTDAAGVNVANGNYSIVFSIYSVATGGTAAWTETQPTVAVANGLFNVVLGSVTVLPSNLFDGSDRYLGIRVGADAEMTPRQRITSVGYARRAQFVDQAPSTSSTDITDEAGVSVSQPYSFNSIAVGGREAADSVTITIPAAGLVVVEAGGLVSLLHVTGTNSNMWINIDQTRAAPVTATSFQWGWAPAALPTAQYGQNFHCQRSYVKAAGAHTFYLNAQSVSGAGTDDEVNYVWIKATYYPTIYGTSSLAEGAEMPLISPGDRPSTPTPRAR